MPHKFLIWRLGYHKSPEELQGLRMLNEKGERFKVLNFKTLKLKDYGPTFLHSPT